MLKKMFSILLSVLMVCISISPSLANSKYAYINSRFVSDFNVNKSSKSQIVQFVSNEDATTSSGLKIPKGTLFEGKITAMKKSRFAFRRAKAKIDINKMVLPDGTIYKISGQTKRHVLKGSAAANTIKGVFGVPATLIVGSAGAVVVLVEAISIVGILIIPPTAMLIGGSIGKLSNGVNYKRKSGDDIELKIKNINYNRIHKQSNNNEQTENIISE